MSRIPTHISFYHTALATAAGAALLIAVTAGCSEGNGNGVNTSEERTAERPAPTPRRTAYPRISIPSATYSAIDSLPIILEANTSAKTAISNRTNENIWLDVTYPDLNAVIYITVSDAATPGQMAEIIANRSERIALNLSGNPTESREFSPYGSSAAQLIIDRYGTSTPVHFLAALPYDDCPNSNTAHEEKSTYLLPESHHGFVLSGTAFIEANAAAASDSIAPVIDMLVRDISHMLTTAKLP